MKVIDEQEFLYMARADDYISKLYLSAPHHDGFQPAKMAKS